MSNFNQLKAMWEKKAMEDKQKVNDNANLCKPLPNTNKFKINDNKISNNSKQQETEVSFSKQPIKIKQEGVKQHSKIDRQMKEQKKELPNNKQSNKNQPSFILSNPSIAENISNNSWSPANPINVRMMVNSTNQALILGKNIYNNVNQNHNKMPKFYQIDNKDVQTQRRQQAPFELNAALQKAFNNCVTRNQKKTGPSFLPFDQYD